MTDKEMKENEQSAAPEETTAAEAVETAAPEAEAQEPEEKEPPVFTIDYLSTGKSDCALIRMDGTE